VKKRPNDESTVIRVTVVRIALAVRTFRGWAPWQENTWLVAGHSPASGGPAISGNAGNYWDTYLHGHRAYGFAFHGQIFVEIFFLIC
jgi:hypothetical protein